MKRAVLMSAVAAALLTVSLAAQGRSFGGSWTVDSEKTAASNPAVMAGGRGGGGARSGGGGGGGAVMVASSATTTASAGAVAAGGGGRGGGGVARSGGAGTPAVTTVTVDANTFTLVQGQTTTSYRTDGSVTNLDNEMRKASAKASWQGDKLVVETTTDTPNGPIVAHSSWYLEGEWLVRESKSTSADGTDVIRKTYYKRSTTN
jgi:hypothetical protein